MLVWMHFLISLSNNPIFQHDYFINSYTYMDNIKSPNIDLGEFQPDHLRPIPTIISTDFPWIENLINVNV